MTPTDGSKLGLHEYHQILSVTDLWRINLVRGGAVMSSRPYKQKDRYKNKLQLKKL